MNNPLPELTADEVARYSRHLIMPEVALEGQLRLKSASVLLIGAGGLGSPLGLYLAAAGVGVLGIVDFDVVDFSNLQRQVIHGTPDVGRPKLESAAARLRAINPEIEIRTHAARLTSANALEILTPYDIVVDGTDNFPTRYLVNDACVMLHKPNVYGSIFRFEGQASVFFPPAGPCYRCLYPEPPPPGLVPSCAEGGVLGILPGVIGCIQATETIKLILQKGETLLGRLLLYDALAMRFQELHIRRDPACVVCGDSPTLTQLIDYEQFCGVSGESSPQSAPIIREISVETLQSKRERGDSFQLLDVRNPEEASICRIAGACLIPLNELPTRLQELDPHHPIVVHCKSGARSAKAAKLLQEAGFSHVENLRGGILEWADKIDRTLPKY